MSSAKRITVWILNGIVAVACILAIVGYFFAPFWQIGIRYPLTASSVKGLLGTDEIEGVKIDEIFSEESTSDLNLSVAVGMNDLFSSFSPDSEAMIDSLIDKNVDTIVDQLGGVLDAVMPKVAKSTAQKFVKDEVKSTVKDLLSSPDSPVSSEEVEQTLKDLGITDEYIDEATGQLADLFTREEGTTVDEVVDKVLDVADDIYGKFSSSDDPNLKDFDFSDEDRDSVRQAVEDVFSDYADEDGNIDIYDILAKFLADANGSSDDDTSKNTAATSLAADTAPAAEEKDSAARLKQELKTYITNNIFSQNSDVARYVKYALMGFCAFYLLGILAWVYVLIKLIVKVCGFAVVKDPTVRLKAPILFGWLPFLLLFLAPTVLFPVIKTFLPSILGGAEQVGMILEVASINFFTSGWIALLAAGICLAISIYFIIVRSQLKRESGNSHGSQTMQEAAIADQQEQ